ncbi:uncharacterized protein LOC123310992 [Coccinella septempunctata]|uniref:uncharacterized protein LOC123310992 n=1 Tax=Coccinella septempunctata TaxID=41139 RepID=UPI001D07255A|nr:uncharacterized protein LOC123310992 [Coccinella septempunctata]
MSTWKPDEINVIHNYLQNKSGPIKAEDHKAIKERLPGRSIPAIKKKCLELKHNPNLPNRTNKWTSEEINRLISEYAARPEAQISARIDRIVDLFPGRTKKAIATKLRENHPEIYYRTTTQVPPQNTNTAQPQNANTAQPESPVVTQRGPQISPERTPQPTSRIHPSEEEDQHSPEHTIQINEDELKTCREAFQKIFCRTGDSKPRINKFLVKPNNMKSIQLINHILQERIHHFATNCTNQVQQRKNIKKAIYVAGILLKKYIVKKTGPPDYKITEDKIKLLNNSVDNAKKILNWKGGNFGRSLTEEARRIKKAKMTTSEYITMLEDRMALLQQKLDKLKSRHRVNAIRRKFSENPSVKLINTEERVQPPNKEDVEKFYAELYKKHESTTNTPALDRWIAKLQRETASHRYQDQLQESRINEQTLQVLAKSAPWKAPGEDGIPAYLYKTFPAAKSYLQRFIYTTITGEHKMAEPDCRAEVVLIHKKGDNKDPENYRPIALLNTDYKILTGVIRNTLQKHLPDWAIPTEQLARENVWGTIQGMLIDKAITQRARQNRAKHYSAWYDFKKAFDTISHRHLKRMISVLPLHKNIKRLLKTVMELWTLRVRVGKGKTAPIYIKRGLYQGDSLSPLLFILLTACIIEHLKTSPQIIKNTRGQFDILAFMDDIKCHVKTKKALKTVTDEIRRSGEEIGLVLNTTKCGRYCRVDDEDDHNAPFLPQIREGYKYLGLEQLERDSARNYDTTEEKILKETEKIFRSPLTVPQKVHLFNTATVPSAIYVLGNIYPDEKRSTTLKKCRDLDKAIRKILTIENHKGRTTSNAHVYLPIIRGGMGLKNIELETEIQLARRGIYLKSHADLAGTRKKYEELKAAGWRNPISDHDFVMKKYRCPTINYQQENLKQNCKIVKEHICQTFQQELENEWSQDMHYGKVVLKEKKIIEFPAYTSPLMDHWRFSLLHSAAEEQLHGLGGTAGRSKKCRRCNTASETAYHVSSGCIIGAYTTRHDYIVHWILKHILLKQNAPQEILANFPFGKATCNPTFETGGRKIIVRAGGSIYTEKIHHNKPDIMVRFTNPDVIYIFEIAVAHVQNIRTQEKIKKVRYSVNGAVHIDHTNCETAGRDLNLIGELESQYHCPVHLGIFVVGCYGEVLNTEEHKNFLKLLAQVGLTNFEIRSLINKCSYSVAVSTTNILLKHLSI